MSQAGSRRRLQLALYTLANGYYTGKVTASDSVTGQSSAACDIGHSWSGPHPNRAAFRLDGGHDNGQHDRPVVERQPVARPATTSTATAARSRPRRWRGPRTARAGWRPAPPIISRSRRSMESVGESGLSRCGQRQAPKSRPLPAAAGLSRNYAHVQAGRAHDSGGYALANGSNQNMGLDNTFDGDAVANRSGLLRHRQLPLSDNRRARVLGLISLTLRPSSSRTRGPHFCESLLALTVETSLIV